MEYLDKQRRYKLYEKLFSVSSLSHQINIYIEEISEFMTEISRLRRNRSTRDNIISEIVDLYICFDQFTYILDQINDIDIIHKLKIENFDLTDYIPCEKVQSNDMIGPKFNMQLSLSLLDILRQFEHIYLKIDKDMTMNHILYSIIIPEFINNALFYDLNAVLTACRTFVEDGEYWNAFHNEYRYKFSRLENRVTNNKFL